MRWTWDSESSCWLCGTPENGAGVGTCRTGYDGVVTRDGDTVRIGVFDSLEDVKDEAERVLREPSPALPAARPEAGA